MVPTEVGMIGISFIIIARFFFPTQLAESSFILDGILTQWRILKSLRDVFGLVSWVMLILLKFVMGPSRRSAKRDIERAEGV
jgi:hypothetical protein